MSEKGFILIVNYMRKKSNKKREKFMDNNKHHKLTQIMKQKVRWVNTLKTKIIFRNNLKKIS